MNIDEIKQYIDTQHNLIYKKLNDIEDKLNEILSIILDDDIVK